MILTNNPYFTMLGYEVYLSIVKVKYLTLCLILFHSHT